MPVIQLWQAACQERQGSDFWAQNRLARPVNAGFLIQGRRRGRAASWRTVFRWGVPKQDRCSPGVTPDETTSAQHGIPHQTEIQQDRDPEQNLESKLARLVPQDLLCCQGARPAAQQREQMEEGFRDTPATLAGSGFVQGVNEEGGDAEGDANADQEVEGHDDQVPNFAGKERAFSAGF